MSFFTSLITKLSCFIFLFIITNFLWSQNKNFNKKIETDFTFGINHTLSDYISAQQTLDTKFYIKYLLSNNTKYYFGPALAIGSNKFKFKENNLGLPNRLSTNVKNLGIALELQYIISNSFYPFLNTGFSYSWFEFSPTDYFSNIINQKNGKIKSSPIFDFNLGIKLKVYNSINLLLQTGFHYAFNDNFDGISIGSYNDYNINLSAGISINLWSKIDADADGIFDDEDKCKYSNEDFDGFEDEDGCPDYDNDGDGILDVDDKCPNEPEDFDGFEDEDGCPDYDNDGDKILDFDDKCPNEPEDFDGFKDEDGCHDYDNDSDEILDVDDKCPDETETFNGFEDEDGCPDIIPTPTVKTDKSTKKGIINQTNIPSYFTLQSDVTFDRSISIIQSNVRDELINIAQIMIENPLIKWRIEGHVDNLNSKAESISISRKMAELIKNYLKNLGVSERNLQAVGLGDSSPIASNNTVFGRMKNRRVIIRRVN